jgi:CRISPR-associated protein Csb2
MLSLIPTADRRLRWYVAPSGARVWSTVTPVILPGYDDRDSNRTEELLRTALDHAGFPTQLRDQALLEWRSVGFRAGLDLARRYKVSTTTNDFRGITFGSPGQYPCQDQCAWVLGGFTGWDCSRPSNRHDPAALLSQPQHSGKSG